MDRSTALQKIRKCLALARSANEHEAAAALRQARKLMDAYQLSELDVSLAEVSEAKIKASASRQPALWEAALANLVASAFGCRLFFLMPANASTVGAYWQFIGIEPAGDIAAYGFSCLLRQAKAARRDYLATALQRCRPANKTRRADVFCQGWVGAVARQLGEFAQPSEAQSALLTAYIDQQNAITRSLTARDRNARGAANRQDLVQGHLAGRAARLHHGVARDTQARHLEFLSQDK
ncbi:DUF2786 domain-containing protein [Parachitinimonas caeni]|uniref:DUF2786 domain-containing protein n=1 Tax=Parachitinimonas caeni TaxID=3031301 RepID=A0ABT7E2G8_9NEIS|nr:DUF2786 domain-containing protein [Parachitinimonas caeni]MDK2126500.1 DUF2786 domain-containing protein [Parachitinimonas caeni]